MNRKVVEYCILEKGEPSTYSKKKEKIRLKSASNRKQNFGNGKKEYRNVLATTEKNVNHSLYRSKN